MADKISVNGKDIVLFNLKTLLDKIPRMAQRQDATLDQIRDLIEVANKLGMYDAADSIRAHYFPSGER